MTDPVEQVFRQEAGRCTASLIRILGDVDLAEDAVGEAWALAVERWAIAGVPPNPGAWITTVARNRAIDRLRRDAGRDAKHREALRILAPEGDGGRSVADHRRPLEDLDALAEAVTDDQLRLMFLCAHPALSPDAQVALILRLLGGLTTGEIARAFVVPEATVAQRIVRAKRKLAHNHARYRIPEAAELPDRLRAVLAAVMLIYNEGHMASGGDVLTRDDLRATALRLGRVLQALMPDEQEVAGLLALMVLTEARRPARTSDDGAMVRLADQDRGLWDRDGIAEGHAIVRACLRRNQPGPYQLQAAIAAVHADAPDAASIDWAQIVALYDHLLGLRPDAVVALNRAVAVGEASGAPAGLVALGAIDAAALDTYLPFHAARADLLARAGRVGEAVAAYDRALALTANDVERGYLAGRRAAVAGRSVRG